MLSVRGRKANLIESSRSASFLLTSFCSSSYWRKSAIRFCIN